MPVLEEEPQLQKPAEERDGNLLVDLENHPLAEGKIPFFHRRGVVIGAAILLIGAIVYLATIFFHSLTHESSDDAFIDAHIVSIAPKIAGRVLSVDVRDNELVKRGQVLLKLDPRDAEAAVAQKQASLQVAQAHLENAQASADQAAAHVDTLKAALASVEATTTAAAADTQKLQGDFLRNKDLVASGAISTQDFEHSLADVTSSKATLESKQKQLQAAEALAVEAKKQAVSALAQVAAAKAEVAESQAELRQAQLQESYTVVTAPEPGRVTNKSVEPGNYVQVGQALFAIVPEHVWVTANFKETQLTDMRPGQPALVEVDAYPGRDLHGHVDSIQAGSGARFSLLPPENATGNFVKVVQRVPVKIVFDEQPAVQHVLGPGMSAVPDVKVKGAFWPAVEVSIIALVASALVVGAAFWWLRKVHAS